jgi:hypothetical protein
MHFNTKYIFAGDSASEIKKKINYNFDQIISFAVGPNGHQGPKGSAGYDGPSGKKGTTGATGLRGTLWYKSDDSPTSGNPFDLWIDSNTSDYRVNYLGTTGSWLYTGYSLFTSPYFSVYSPILGPGGVTDKYAIGISAGLTASDTSLVIGDDYPSISGINPSRSKLLISTDDQTTRPILTFSKTGAVSSGVPGFYWTTTGNSASLRYSSTGSFELSAKDGITIDSYTARTILYGDQAVIDSASAVTIGGTGDFYLNSNTTIGVGGQLSISSSNLVLSSSSFISRIPIKIQIDGLVPFGSFPVFKAWKFTPSGVSTSTAGINILGSSVQDSVFEFFDLKNAPIFSAKARGSVSSGKHIQTTFGSTGGQAPGATGGPYLYPVKRVKEVRASTITLNARIWEAPTSFTPTVYNVIDLTSVSLWDSNLILVTPTAYNLPASYEVFLRIPTSYEQNVEGLYNAGYTNTYRIFLNDITSSSQVYKIAGLVFNYWDFTAGVRGRTTVAPIQYFMRFRYQPSMNAFPTESCYVDLTFVGSASTTNGNPRLFWKTCDGISGYITLTDRYSVGSIVSVSGKAVLIGKTAPTFIA